MKFFVITYCLLLLSVNVVISQENNENDVESPAANNNEGENTEGKVDAAPEDKDPDNNGAEPGEERGTSDDTAKQSAEPVEEKGQGDDTTKKSADGEEKGQRGDTARKDEKGTAKEDDGTKTSGVDDEDDQDEDINNMDGNGNDYDNLGGGANNTNVNEWNVDDETPFDIYNKSAEDSPENETTNDIINNDVNGFSGNSSDFDFSKEGTTFKDILTMLEPQNILQSYRAFKAKKEAKEHEKKKNSVGPSGSSIGSTKLGKAGELLIVLAWLFQISAFQIKIYLPRSLQTFWTLAIKFVGGVADDAVDADAKFNFL